MGNDDVEIFKNVVCKTETFKAILVVINGKEYWIAKSQIDDDSEVYQDGDEGKLIIKTWLAEKLGLA
jgi:hypothetical protein